MLHNTRRQCLLVRLFQSVNSELNYWLSAHSRFLILFMHDNFLSLKLHSFTSDINARLLHFAEGLMHRNHKGKYKIEWSQRCKNLYDKINISLCRCCTQTATCRAQMHTLTDTMWLQIGCIDSTVRMEIKQMEENFNNRNNENQFVCIEVG